MKSNKNLSFLKGTISLSISVIITKILGVSFKIPLSYILGDEGMGYFNTAYAIYGFFYILCTAGVPKSLTLVLSENRANSGEKNDIQILRAGLKLFLLIGAFSSLLNIICAPFFSRIVGNSKACLSIILVAPAILFVSLGGVLRGFMSSNEKLSVIAISQLIEGGVKLALGLLLSFVGVKNGAPIYVISALAILGITLGSALSFLYMLIKSNYLKHRVKARQNITLSNKAINKKILKSALPIALSSSLLNLSSTLDIALIIRRLVESGMNETQANAVYGNYTTLAVPMFNLVISVLSPIATSYMPRLSFMNIKGDERGFILSLNRLLSITLIIATPASFAFFFYGFELLDILFSVQSSALGADMLICLSVGLCFLSALTVVNTALESKGKIYSAVISLLLGSAVKAIASYALIANDTLGILGAPIGTVLSYAFSLVVSLVFLEISGVKIFAIAKMLLLALSGFITFYLPYYIVYSTSLLGSPFYSMIISIGISVFAYFSLLALGYFLFIRRSVSKLHKNVQ